MQRCACIPIVINQLAAETCIMPTQPPLLIGPNEKLRLLRQLDAKRRWQFLDDERRCRCCGKHFTGRQVKVLSATSPGGPLRVACPTRNCVSKTDEWLYLHETPARVGHPPFYSPGTTQIERTKSIYPQLGSGTLPQRRRIPGWLSRVKRGLDPMHHFGTG